MLSVLSYLARIEVKFTVDNISHYLLSPVPSLQHKTRVVVGFASREVTGLAEIE